ncbi:MAG: aminomethyl transferase family protein [Chloroflexi bacterium]|nr:aminomethyl transferase family protein [Chloroflexota bacterium]
MLLPTPLHPRTAPLCQQQNWRPWAGYMAAGSYEASHDREYWAIRNAAALIDVSPLFKCHISGPDAARLLDRVVTRDVSRCAVGQVLYTPWCDEHGKVIDDGTVARLDETAFRLTSADPALRWLHLNAPGLRVQIRDVSDTLAALALQGPRSREILNSISDVSLDGLRYFRLADARLDGLPVTISRTGYTGDLGYEIWVPAGEAVPLWDALTRAGTGFGLAPAGILALDVARVEAGLLMAEVDYVSAKRALIEARKSSPTELGLGWAVAPEKGYFVGQRALRARQQRGPAWDLVGLEVDWETLERLYRAEGLPPQLPAVAWRTSVPVFSLGRQVGYASSGCWSPLLKKYLALAHVRPGYAQSGTLLTMEVTVEHQRKWAPARVVKTPFYEPGWKRG